MTIRLLYWLSFFFTSMSCVAQSYHSEAITISHGLPSNRVNSVVQDSLGQLWISTNKGISVYDGMAWNHFADSIPMPINTNTRMKIFPSGRILILGQAKNFHFIGNIYQNNQWVEFPLPHEANYEPRRLWAAEEVKNDLLVKVYIYDTLYTYRESDKAWTKKLIPVSLGYLNKLRIFNGTTYLLTRKGIFKEDQNGFTPILTSNATQTYDVNDLLVNDTVTYVLGMTWVGELKEKGLRKFSIHFVESELRLNELHLSKNGLLFFRSDIRYYWINPTTENYLGFKADNDDALPLSAKLYFDRENNLWLTSHRGLHKINSFHLLGYTANNGLLEYEVSSIAEISPNKFFIGGQRSYTIIDDNNIVLASLLNSSNSVLSSRTTGAITVVKNNTRKTYVAGQELGLGIITSDNKISWLPPPKRGIDVVNYLNDTLWVVDRPGDLYYLLNNKFVPAFRLHNYARSIYSNEKGDKLICTTEGLRVIRNDTTFRITSQNDILLKNVYCMFRHDGLYYLGTDAGLAIWKGNTIVPALLDGVSITNPVYAVIKVSENEYWFGTDKGIFLIKDNKKFHYDDSNGLLGVDVNRGAFLQASNGTILVGTNRGLNFFDLKMQSPLKQIFSPQLLSLQTVDSTYSTSHDLSLPHTSNNLIINFRSISFSGHPVEFRYRMNNFESAWSNITSKDIRSVQYRNLPPGDYTFELQSKVGDNPWSKSVVSSRITIHNPFYTTWWFILSAFLVAIGLGYMINKMINQFYANRRLKQLINAKIQEVERNEAHLQLALENARMGVWTYDFRLKTIEYSVHLFESLNISLPAGPVNADVCRKYVHPEDLKKIETTLEKSIKTQRSFDLELRLRSDDSFKWIQVKGKCIYNNESIAIRLSGTFIDINDRKQYEAEREKLIEELEQTNRELDRFVYSASHDLSAPMKSVMGLINLARLNPSAHEMQNYLSLIDKSVKKQDEFIKEIIAFARNSRTEVILENIDFREILDETLSNLKYTDQFNRTEFKIEIPPDSAHIMCDRVRLKIILNNILSNAIKFQRVDVVQHQVNVELEKNHKSWQIKITDNGEGIKTDRQAKVFSMFYRATDSMPGSGLGLYIAKEAAEKMGGNISMQSEYGKGSTFTLSKVI